jgi:hypothetical protein
MRSLVVGLFFAQISMSCKTPDHSVLNESVTNKHENGEYWKAECEDKIGKINWTKLHTRPDSELTPGQICKASSERRYPEQIKYCGRHVEKDRKDEVILLYDRKWRTNLANEERDTFKIDHLIPVCVGGTNQIENLWPQHVDIGRYTDPIEPKLCFLMEHGKMKQSEAVELIKKAKLDYTLAPKICKDLDKRIAGLNL